MPTYTEKLSAVDLAIEHIIENGLDDIVKPPAFLDSIELAIIQENLDDFRTTARKKSLSFLNTANLLSVGIGNPQYFMIPKDEHTLRKVSWIDPFDLVKYLSASLLLFSNIESSRPEKSSGIIHSHRKSSSTTEIFDENFGYESFRRKSSELSLSRIGQWKVVTDISNFFDRIGNHPLENHLQDCECDTEVVSLVREILYQWSGDRRSFGIPVGSDASRILSEAALIAVDRQLQEQNITYVRYVDDFRIFAETRAAAYNAVRILSELLSEEGLHLNNLKTNIFQILDHIEIPDSDNENLNLPHNQIDVEQQIEIQRRIQTSGKSSFSRYYRYPGQDAVRVLQNSNLQDILTAVSLNQGSDQEIYIRTATKYFVYVRQDTTIIEHLLESKITSLFYIVDALIRDADRIDNNVKLIARDAIINTIDAENLSYPFQIPILRLCSTEGYEDSRLINSVIDGHRQIGNSQFFREAILLGFQQVDRQKIRRLATTVYPNATAPLQRAIYYALRNYSRMERDEKRPILRNMKQATSDWFIQKSSVDSPEV